METIENNRLKITINPLGGILTSIFFKDVNKEMEYQIEKDAWQFQDVVIFPLIGEGKFTYDNKQYKMDMRHGFIRKTTLKVLENNGTKITLYTESDEKTLSEYPFKFSFTLTYELIDNKLSVKTTVKNLDNKEMYFSYGSHTGIKAAAGVGLINFDKEYHLLPLLVDAINTEPFEHYYFNCVNLRKRSFINFNTLVFEGKEEKIELYTGYGSLCVDYEFDAPYFAIWSNPHSGNFVCVEPWRGISNYVTETEDLSQRLSINKLKENESKSFSYSLTFSNKESID